MIRWGLRALVVVYLLLPVAAVVIGVATVRNITGTLAPIYDAASTRINNAAEAMEDELDDLRDNFQPLVNAVNAVRNALSTIRTFVNNQVNRVINFVNTFPGINISPFSGFDLPGVVDLSFLRDMAGHFRDIKDEIRDTFSATGDFFKDQAGAIGLIGLLLLGWFLVSHILGAVVVVRSLWR